MSILRRLFSDIGDRDALRPLYDAIVAEARRPFWYREGAVADSVDGRFDMLAAILALVLIRLEAEGEAGRAPSALLAELFVDDMDSQLRQIGIGDIVVGKHVGRMMGALGGRLTAYRDTLGPNGDPTGLPDALRRNVYRETAPDDAAVARVAERLERLRDDLAETPAAALLAGGLPTP